MPLCRSGGSREHGGAISAIVAGVPPFAPAGTPTETIARHGNHRDAMETTATPLPTIGAPMPCRSGASRKHGGIPMNGARTTLFLYR